MALETKIPPPNQSIALDGSPMLGRLPIGRGHRRMGHSAIASMIPRAITELYMPLARKSRVLSKHSHVSGPISRY